MASTQNRQPAIPALAERARTLAARSHTATVMAAGITGRPMPMLHHVEDDSSVLLLLAEDHDLPALVDFASGGEVSAMAELSDIAPVALREPVRGMLWITGWLHPLAPAFGRRVATWWAERRPDPCLLDVGHTASLLWLEPVFAVFSDSEGSGWLTPETLAHAQPDPLSHFEHTWLLHLERHHPEVMNAAVQHLAAGPQHPDVQVRPLSIDRLGVRLRIEGNDHTQDVRLAFHHPAATPVQLAEALYDLLSGHTPRSGCRLRSPGPELPQSASRTRGRE